MTVRQKLDMILENKVVYKLKLENNVFYKKIVFLIDILKRKKKKVCQFLTSKIDFESTVLALFDGIYFLFSFEYVDSWQKILPFRTHHL